MSRHIGIVEDDENIQKIVSAYLREEGYITSIVGSAEEAWELWQKNPPDMWILDIMLPGMDGYDFCRRIRKESEVPIIIISAKDDEIDKILGLELGGDDYLTKPFSPRELVARVKRVFHRTDLKTERLPEDKIKVGSLFINERERRIFWNGEERHFTTKEFDLLFLLAKHANRAFSREELLIKVWGEDYFGSDRAVDDLVKRIRQKITEIPLETVWGFGYRYRDEG